MHDSLETSDRPALIQDERLEGFAQPFPEPGSLECVVEQGLRDKGGFMFIWGRGVFGMNGQYSAITAQTI
jgi:hypothetical protein